MKKGRKIVYILLIFVLVGLVLFFYNAFNGNPLSKQLSKKALQDYLVEEYPTDEFNVSKAVYNFKDGGYYLDARKIGSDEEYGFILQGLLSFEVISDGIYVEHLDEELMEKLGEQASAFLFRSLENDVPELFDISAHMEVLKGTYEGNIPWSPALKTEAPMGIIIFLDAENMSKNRLLAIANLIQERLKEEKVDYEYVSLNANEIYEDEIQALKYGISFEADSPIEEKNIEHVTE